MTIRLTPETLLIYSSLVSCLCAFILFVIGSKKLSRFLFACSFAAVALAFIQHTANVKQIPLQTMYEVFLVMAVLVYPLALWCRRIQGTFLEPIDMVIAAAVLFPCGFIFNPESSRLPPALQSWHFAPHVLAYMLAYIFMTKAAIIATYRLFCGEQKALEYESAELGLVKMGFPLLTLGLILGCMWAKVAWGRYWGWDPKELWGLAVWLIYAGYFQLNKVSDKKLTKVKAFLAILGLIFILITLLWVNLSSKFSELHNYAA